MKKFLISLSALAIFASFTSCNCNSDCNDSDCGSEKKELATEASEHMHGAKCGEGKCGSAKSDEAKPDKFAMIDTDKNGSLTEEEFTSFASAQFPKKDKNSDGFLSKEECDHFSMANTDGDDKISEEEFNAALNSFFLSIDTDSNGDISKDELMAHIKAEQAETHATEHKCGEGKCGEGKCGAKK